MRGRPAALPQPVPLHGWLTAPRRHWPGVTAVARFHHSVAPAGHLHRLGQQHRHQQRAVEPVPVALGACAIRCPERAAEHRNGFGPGKGSQERHCCRNVSAARYRAQFIRNTGNYIRFAYQVDAENCGTTNCDGCVPSAVSPLCPRTPPVAHEGERVPQPCPPSDGTRSLIFYIDNVAVMPMRSSALSWTTVTFNVTKGETPTRTRAPCRTRYLRRR